MALWQTMAIVVTVLIWLNTPPTSLADASRREALRRQLMPKATRALTDQDVDQVPARPLPQLPQVPEAPAAVAATAAPERTEASPVQHDETWWRERMASARKALDRDRLLAESLQSRINALTTAWSGRDDPVQRQQLSQQRVRTIAELDAMKEKIASGERAIAEIEDDARRENALPGWIR